MVKMNLFTKTEIESQIHNIIVTMGKRERRGGINWVIGIDI